MPLNMAITVATEKLINDFLSKNTIDSLKSRLSYFLHKSTDLTKDQNYIRLTNQIDNYESFKQTTIDLFLNEANEVSEEAVKYTDISKSTQKCINELLKIAGKFNKTDESSCHFYEFIDKLIKMLSGLLFYSGDLTKLIDPDNCHSVGCFSGNSFTKYFRSLFTRKELIPKTNGGKRKRKTLKLRSQKSGI